MDQVVRIEGEEIRITGAGCQSRLPNCGGNWNNTSNAGVFYVNLNNTRSNTNTNIGFRSALPHWSETMQLTGAWAVR